MELIAWTWFAKFLLAFQCVLMLSGDNCSGVSELAEGYTYIRGRCKQLGNLYSPNRNDGTEYEFTVCTEEITSPIDAFEKHPEDICRRLSMSEYTSDSELTFRNELRRWWSFRYVRSLIEIIDLCFSFVSGSHSFPLFSVLIAGAGEATKKSHNKSTDTHNDNDILSPSSSTAERRLSRDIGTQAFSLDFEEEKSTRTAQTSTHTSSNDTTQQTEINVSFRKSSIKFNLSHHPTQRTHLIRCSFVSLSFSMWTDSKADAYFINKETRSDTCHFHRIISPHNEVIIGWYWHTACTKPCERASSFR